MAEHDALTPDEVGEFYDDRGWLWEIFMGQNLHIGYWDDKSPGVDPKDRLTDVMVERVGIGPGQRLLDVGCGRGRPAIRLAKSTGASVKGITVSADQVEGATREAEAAGVAERVDFERADAMALPFGDATFDAVWAMECVMYLTDRQKAIEEMQRVLVPGGVLVLSDYAETMPLSPEWRDVLAESFTVDALPTPQDYLRMLTSAGFTVQHDEDAGYHLRRSAARIDRTVEENYHKVVSKGGAEFAAEFKAMIGKVAQLERDLLGYRIITALKSA
ncbi:methyltransferase domain-containing protein [Streptomyces chumphonensis]|uniref:Methyltransferase domain-containing protein n=1 Tax=Streptomyces chumphonensis TaxID=1214925 RepID=A0A927EWN2_9ACTN|nr:methyltransferase domain-containing protein [Streptomyces chumphonensis]MBD3931016.1 methyltransferase domain-containing protein [Streptomyces chumphonensis]